jgi:hypothetical protein
MCWDCIPRAQPASLNGVVTKPLNVNVTDLTCWSVTCFHGTEKSVSCHVTV